MSTVEESIDVEVPVRVVYDQWATFEDFPQFMEGVEEVRQLDEHHAHWRTKIAGLARSSTPRSSSGCPRSGSPGAPPARA
ncbi:SRPBCC family protein [Kitasatospora aburaviensis]